jgi:Na+-transporting NADH:ubiquinone oxidoreductase subunit NqrB
MPLKFSLAQYAIDPRYYQLFIQSSLLVWGVWVLAVFPEPKQVLLHLSVTLSTALLLQWWLTSRINRPINALSAINTSFSLVLLLHANHWLWFVVAAALAIGSKFVLRWQSSHLFNPSNIAIVALILLSDQVWVASGQWGQTLWLALLLAGFGLIAFLGVGRLLTSLTFLAVYSALLLGRACWLNDGWAIPLHQLQNGALLIFTFFMLSDPMTTPRHGLARLIYGASLALAAWILQFFYYIPNAFLYTLALASPFVVILNQRLQGESYQWVNK